MCIRDSYVSMTSKDKQMQTGMAFLRDIASNLNIVDVTYKKACEILKKVHDLDLAKGARLNTKCGTIMYIACRTTNNTTEVKDILKACRIGNKDLSKCFKIIKPALPGANLGITSSKYAEDACTKM